jgi:L,D-transpeptidase ErfK/SrfK
MKRRIITWGRKRFSALLGASLLGVFLLEGCTRSSGKVPGGFSKDGAAAIGGRNLDVLRSQKRTLEARVRRLEAVESRLFPAGPAILVDTSQSRITLMQGSRVIVQGTCSSGSGMELTDAAGKRSWTFDTPRGHFRVVGKITDPVWYRPDWSYIEEGEPIPKDHAKRAMPNVLGDYAIAFGNGFFIHGTLYTRLLGNNVTHGCIRVDDETLKKLYSAAQPGTPIWIY